MAYTSIDDPTLYFNTKLYTGTGSTQSITGVGFQPDFVWLKDRSASNNHGLSDVVRGVTQRLVTNSTGAESTQSGGTTSFDSDGFSLGTFVYANTSGNNYVAWNWLAGGTASSNTDGSITSSVSANTTAGFSIVSYTGTGSTATVGHGLGVTPKMMTIKSRDQARNWVFYTTVIDGSIDFLYLNNTNAKGDSSATVPTSSLLNLTSGAEVNASGEDYIAYCFAEKKGFSKFGSYTGNGNNSDGTFVYTGFKPAWIMVKRTDTAGHYWPIMDSVRSPYNEISKQLYAGISDAEYDNAPNNADFLSNGFKLYHSATPSPDNTNASGGTYIYMAFAENPFVTSTSIPCTAR